MAIGEDVYVTLVLTDSYLPGAAVLAYSLRDCGTNKKLACMLTGELRASTIKELESLYDYLIPVDVVGNPSPANLYLMNRPDLLHTFTKINLWRLTQFRKIVYIDADVVALKAPEELFDIQESFAAAPDVGWPDIFNTGVMVLTPNNGDYSALRRIAEAGDSFDGADQGLLNEYFENQPWKRLSFTYNTTPSANYQYEPAYRYYKSSIKMVHFIGSQKPWQQGAQGKGPPSAYQEMLSRWWAVWDRHFEVGPDDYIAGHKHPVPDYLRPDGHQNRHPVHATGHSIDDIDQGNGVPKDLPNYPMPLGAPTSSVHIAAAPVPEVFSAPQVDWDPAREAPPHDSKPEAANLDVGNYEFSEDAEPFRPPQSYPEPPRESRFTTSKPKPQPEKLQPIFPWEEREMSRPSRRFIEDEVFQPAPEPEPEWAFSDELEVRDDLKVEPRTPIISLNDSAPWHVVTSNRNAWDEVSGIDDYVRALTAFQKNRGKVQVLQTNVPSHGQSGVLSPQNEPDPDDLVQAIEKRRESMILTDFPTAVERPSLPVTPAPIRRANFWSEERDDRTGLPPAAGVPHQVDWDPSAQLEELRRNSFIGQEDLKLPPSKALPTRDMPEDTLYPSPPPTSTQKPPNREVSRPSGSTVQHDAPFAAEALIKETGDPTFSTRQTTTFTQDSSNSYRTRMNAYNIEQSNFHPTGLYEPGKSGQIDFVLDGGTKPHGLDRQIASESLATGFSSEATSTRTVYSTSTESIQTSREQDTTITEQFRSDLDEPLNNQEITNLNTSYNASRSSDAGSLGSTSAALLAQPGVRVTSETAMDELDYQQSHSKQTTQSTKQTGDASNGRGLLG